MANFIVFNVLIVRRVIFPRTWFKTLSRLFGLLFLSITLQACSPEPSSPPNQEQQNQEQQQEHQAKTSQTQKLEPNKEKQFQLVMLGDSITAGFGLNATQALPVKLEQLLRKNGNHITVINAGVSGDTTKDALNRFEWSVGPQANGVLIALGGNDLLQGIAPNITKNNLEKIIQNAQQRNLTVLLAGMRAPGNYGVEYQNAFDQLFPDLAKQYKIPLYPFLLEGVATNPALNQRDGIHPNTKGVKIISENLSAFIDSNTQP